ncbi:hypothetical protein LCGC14_2552180 [marine sediment metagenome]|uniref:Uncharacterized protein n=1 Tax=marine sediment metagenome TaxID=412755 RepID=A0A0F9DFL8_9ZZZZ
MKCETLVDKILDSDHHVRFAAIFDMSGNVKASKERKGIVRMVSSDKTKEWAGKAVNSWKNREQLYPLIGEGQYVLAVYKNLKRITMPVGKDHLIYVTFDNDGGQEDIIRAVQNQKPGYGVPGLE